MTRRIDLAWDMSIIDVDDKLYDKLFYKCLPLSSINWSRRLLACLDDIGINVTDIDKIFKDLYVPLSLVRSID